MDKKSNLTVRGLIFFHHFTISTIPQKIKNAIYLVEILIMFFETLQSNMKKTLSVST